MSTFTYMSHFDRQIASDARDDAAELLDLAAGHVRRARRLLTDAEHAAERGHVARAARLSEAAEREVRTASALRAVARAG